MSNSNFQYKIVAVVKFNDGEALVLDKPPILKYSRHGTSIVGTDGVFYQTYIYETPGHRWKAFAGRKFDLVMADGEVIHCYGQYWDGQDKQTIAATGSLIRVTACEIEALKSCYVYFGYKANPEKFEELRKTYAGPVYEYWDYEQMVRPRKKVPLSFFRKYRRKPKKIRLKTHSNEQ